MKISNKIKWYHVICLNVFIGEIIFFEFKSKVFMEIMELVGHIVLVALVCVIVLATLAFLDELVKKKIFPKIDKLIENIPNKYQVVPYGERFGISRRRFIFWAKPLYYRKTVISSSGVLGPSYEMLDFDYEERAKDEAYDLRYEHVRPIVLRHYCDGALIKQERRKKRRFILS